MAPPLSNRLAAETSPYLLQHADNPVHWQPWDEQSLSSARSADRPILLSIGYSACHWCHVMAHESFEDADVAAVMNRLFVNIKVDREERPDLDQIYQSAHHLLTQRNGGWPLTMFLAPDGTPFFGGTYFPKEPRYGLPGFADICARVAAAYAERREDIAAQAVELRQALGATDPEPAAGALRFDNAPLAAAEASLARAFDSRHGGFGGAPKFPHPTDLAFLLRRADVDARRMALTTLARMCEGGIYDQIGGGFCRYSVDERWEIPHFEKMLYDNGPLLGLCADAWARDGDPLFARVADETAGWVMREMQTADGGYCSSLDADSEGEEGKFYVWDRADLARILTSQESALAARRWGFDGPPNFENRHWHAKIAGDLQPEEQSLLDSARQKLFAAREQRIRPGRDDKILASWNALMIEGMAHASRVFDRDDWLASARRALQYVRTTLWRDGRLLATARDGRAHLDAYLDDHAFLLAALLELMQAEFHATDLGFAIELADILLSHFEDPDAGGFYFTAHDHETLIHRAKIGHDNATPAGNGVAAFALQRLGHLLGESRYIDAAERALRLYWPQIQHSPNGFGGLLRALEEALQPPANVILRGPPVEVRTWQRALGAAPGRLVLALPNGTRGLPAGLAKAESDHVNAWVCSGVSCSAPIADLDQLIN
ncbi:thioredoxin domain-containing protein [Sulfuritalea sp.]|uniref:thioredoxin domain-containing protein n=1 Tax=Sulfuritalea sp. TaxID=2480090 RepID=UPI001AC69BF9|nr:thioredoxin domain-containing protein [Sulfuritalea sp.]MBN8477285.1 thioredoxin domain-containing protein [Sulfuritalea sp.]